MSVFDVVTYYAVKKFYGHIQSYCENNEDDDSVFWHAWSIGMTGNCSEAIRLLQRFASDQKYGLAATSALIQFHREAKTKDKDALAVLKQQQKEVSKTRDSDALTVAGCYFWFVGKHRNAKQCLEKVLHVSENPDAFSLLGWTTMTSTNPESEDCQTLYDVSRDYFKKAIELNREHKNLLALLGLAELATKEADYAGALAYIDEIVVTYPHFLPALSERAKIQICMDNWTEAVETGNRVLDLEPKDVDAILVSVLYFLTRKNEPETLIRNMQLLVQSIRSRESRNGLLCCDIAAGVSRCARNPAVLSYCLQLMDMAMEIDQENSHFLCVAASIHLIKGDWSKARGLFKQ